MSLRNQISNDEMAATGWIKIIKIPNSEVPIEIREAWVDLVLPCFPALGNRGDERGILSGKPVPKVRCGVAVPQARALKILANANPQAADWWREHGFPKEDRAFVFAEDEIRILSGVERVTILCDETGKECDRNR